MGIMTSLNSRLQKGLAKKSAFERKCFSLFWEFNQNYEYKSVSLVQEILLNWLSWSMVIMIGEQHTKQSSVCWCYLHGDQKHQGKSSECW